MNDPSDTVPERVGLLGAGVIGGGWAARFLLHGADVALYDPDPEAPRKVAAMVANARRALRQLYPAMPPEGSLTFVGTPEEAVDGAAFVQESAPERVELKRDLLARADRVAPPTVVVASSTSGLRPTVLQAAMTHPERLVVGHPFNPVYLLPLVEVCGGEARKDDVIDAAAAVYRSIGMSPLVLDTEIDGFVADRLLEALWREALWLVNDGVATVSQIDDAIRLGAGLRWSAMGTFLVYRIAGGEAGMRHFLAQFGPALEWPWSKLTDVPELTEELIDRIVEQSDQHAGGRTIGELEARRDECLVAVMKALRTVGFAAGEVVADHEARLRRRAVAVGRPGPGTELGSAGVERHYRHIAVTWNDGHRGEFHHLWLRDNCPCASCRHPQTHERLLDTFALDPDVAPAALTDTGRSIVIDWTDGHVSELDLGWLRRHGHGAGDASPAPATPRHWGAEIAGDLPVFDYAELIDGDDELLAFMGSVSTTGIAFVHKAPTKQDALARLAARVGTTRRTNFGPDFHVQAVAEPNNVAYTAVELRPHTDLPYHEYPPGIQFLHCFVADAPGGDSTLVDGFWVADRLQSLDPGAFRLLCETPIPYRFEDERNDLRFAAPVIGRCADGSYREVRYHDALMAPLDVPPAAVDAVYGALAQFDAIARSDAGQIVVRLRPGDVMVFDNRRILHGRRSFDPGAGRRELFGLYIDADDWRSRMHVLRRNA